MQDHLQYRTGLFVNRKSHIENRKFFLYFQNLIVEEKIAD
jgi:hypothetical protein